MHVYKVVTCGVVIERENELALHRAELRMIRWMCCEMKG